MEPRLSLVTLGVADFKRAIRFYEQVLRASNTVKHTMRWHDFGSGRGARPAA